ncbi:hypothetical protein PANI_CDS0067 [Maribacter phage Panino]
MSFPRTCYANCLTVGAKLTFITLPVIVKLVLFNTYFCCQIQSPPYNHTL